ncbi:ABC-type antimicrobial peptide transport system, permease component [Candidatus Syntrophocurvum alkaliphilum]|uniref:ABC-type antimicrobial peptide transport system, permease component n=2 Tax=Candidatus Syntrophocurvum alkaliphilum TaxID=2293317 RepID=A0A6I6DNC6_9FIRM|nr:ABC-type antimicrobial peptide transport system, permease component [Candidatus Syntrophocurvum alkaliphilum]
MNKLFKQDSPWMAFFIRFWFTAKMAANGVLSNTLRSALTILGVAIGVASVVGLMGIGEGARQNVMEQFESLGTNVIAIQAHDESYEFFPDKSYELVDRVQGLDKATPVVNTDTSMRWRRTSGEVFVVGVNEQFPKIRDHEMVAGDFFSELHVEQRSSVAVLGHNLAINLAGGRSPVGQIITLDGQSYRILGVLDPKGDGHANNIDNKVVIPYTSAQRLEEKRTVEEIWGKAASTRDAELSTVQLGRIFQREMGLAQDAPTPQQPEQDPGGMPGGAMPVQPAPQPEEPSIPTISDDPITITNLNQLVDEVDQANRIMTLLLGGIAAVALLVGGLGIMNIMLVAVTERTSEIGVRRALGAKQTDLMAQFLLEALYLSIIGIICGIIIGIWGLTIFENYGFQTAVSFEAIKIAAAVALGSGLLFGVYPAISASSVPPVEALRRQ